MDEHQVRRWTSWLRWTLLAMIAHALLAVLVADEYTDRPAAADIIELASAEIRRPFITLIVEPARTAACLWVQRTVSRSLISVHGRPTSPSPFRAAEQDRPLWPSGSAATTTGTRWRS